MSKEWYVINDLDGFIDSIRTIVFNSFDSTNNNTKDVLTDVKPEEKEELDNVLSHAESGRIIKSMLKQKTTNKKNKDIQYMVNDDLLYSIVESLNDRMISNILNNLVNKGLLETGFDAKSNDFIFWIKDENKNFEKPETD